MFDDDGDMQIDESFNQRTGATTSFEDSDVEIPKKRKLSSSLRNTKKRQKRTSTSEELTAVPPDYKSAKIIGLLLIALDPSPVTVELVCQSLLATGESLGFILSRLGTLPVLIDDVL